MKRVLLPVALTAAACGGWNELYVECLDAGRCVVATGGGAAGGMLAGGNAVGGGATSGGVAGGAVAGGAVAGGVAGGVTAGGDAGGSSGAAGGASGGTAGGASGGAAGGASGPRLEWSPSSWDAGLLEPGQLVTQTFTLRNTGMGVTDQVQISLGSTPTGFSILRDDCDLLSLDGGATCTTSVRFSPPMVGTFQVNLRAQATGAQTALAPMSGRAALNPIHLSVRADGGSGIGAVSISANGGPPATCPSDCEFDFERGTVVTFGATPTQSTLSSFSGCTPSPDGGCAVTLSSDAGAFVTATFARWPRLTVVVSDGGVPPDYALGLNATGGISGCQTTCSALVAPNSAVIVTAQPSPFARLSGWTGCGATDGGLCLRTVTNSDETVTASFALYNRVFFSPEPKTMDRGGGAYTHDCTAWARDAGLSGRWLAWMSPDGGNPRGGAMTRGFVRTDGLPFIDVITAPERVLYPPLTDHRGVDVSGLVFDAGLNFTIVAGSGAANCAGYTDTGSMRAVGQPGGLLWNSTGSSARPCSEPSHFLCVQNDHSTPLAPLTRAPDGKLMFVTSEQFRADALTESICNRGEFPGRQFRIFRARLGVSAWGVLDAGLQASWYRPDGVLVTTGEQLTRGAGPFFTAHGYQTTDGGSPFSSESVWFGPSSPTAPGSFGTTCGDWTDAGIGITTAGAEARDALSIFAAHAANCSTDNRRVMCFER